ncbi:MAG: hypothetical protein CMP81_06115 [Fulvimarina sp.]|nr:hypothetical protein [Fulvimarina sp.]
MADFEAPTTEPVHDDRTVFFGLPMPHRQNSARNTDVARLRSAFVAIDTQLAGILAANVNDRSEIPTCRLAVDTSTIIVKGNRYRDTVKWVRAESEPAHPMKEFHTASSKWYEIDRETSNGRAFGEWKDGEDVSGVLANIIDWMLDRRYAAIEFPSGQFMIETATVRNVGGVTRSLWIHGKNTTFILDAATASNILKLTQPTLDGTSTYYDFGDIDVLVDGRTPKGEAPFHFDRPEGGALHDTTVRVNNYGAFGLNFGTDLPGRGISLAGQINCVLRTIKVSTPWGPGSSISGQTQTIDPVTGNLGIKARDYSPTADMFLMDCGIYLSGSYGGDIESCYVWGGDYAVINQSVAVQGGEGIRIEKCNFVQNGFCILYTRASQEPGGDVHRNHLNGLYGNVFVNGARLWDMNENDQFQEFNGQTYPTPGYGVHVRAGSLREGYFRDNRHHFGSNPTLVLYRFEGSGTISKDILVRSPFVSCVVDKLVEAPNGAYVTLDRPKIYETGSVRSLITGTYGRVKAIFDQPLALTAGLAAAQTIPTGGSLDTRIGWTQEFKDTTGFNYYGEWEDPQPGPGLPGTPVDQGMIDVRAGAQTTFTMRDDLGVSEFRAVVLTAWDSGASGKIETKVFKNGALPAKSMAKAYGNATGNDQQYLATDWISIAPGDTMSIPVNHTGPGDRTISTETRLRLEFR